MTNNLKKKKLTDNYIQTYMYMTYMREGGTQKETNPRELEIHFLSSKRYYTYLYCSEIMNFIFRPPTQGINLSYDHPR